MRCSLIRQCKRNKKSSLNQQQGKPSVRHKLLHGGNQVLHPLVQKRNLQACGYLPRQRRPAASDRWGTACWRRKWWRRLLDTRRLGKMGLVDVEGLLPVEAEGCQQRLVGLLKHLLNLTHAAFVLLHDRSGQQGRNAAEPLHQTLLHGGGGVDRGGGGGRSDEERDRFPPCSRRAAASDGGDFLQGGGSPVVRVSVSQLQQSVKLLEESCAAFQVMAREALPAFLLVAGAGRLLNPWVTSIIVLTFCGHLACGVVHTEQNQRNYEMCSHKTCKTNNDEGDGQLIHVKAQSTECIIIRKKEWNVFT